jgi:hypothetical protein
MSSAIGTLLDKLSVQEGLATGCGTSRNDANEFWSYVHDDYQHDTSGDRADANKAIFLVGVIGIDDLEVVHAGSDSEVTSWKDMACLRTLWAAFSSSHSKRFATESLADRHPQISTLVQHIV